MSASLGQTRNAPQGSRSKAISSLRSVQGRRNAPSRDTIGEHSPLRTAEDAASYGTILATPSSQHASIGPPALELPDPAVAIGDPLLMSRQSLERGGVRRASSAAGDAYEVGRTHTPSKAAVGLLPKSRSLFLPRRTFSTPDGGIHSRAPILRKLFASGQNQSFKSPDVPLEAYHEFDLRQAEFFNFLDNELNKIESFYKMKEHEAVERRDVLHDQLRIMRDTRVHQLLADQHKDATKSNGKLSENGNGKLGEYNLSAMQDVSAKLIRPLEHALRIGDHVGKNSKALQDMVSAKQRADPGQAEGWRDFSRRPVHEDVPYRIAKRKLKLALQEYYRGLELLKSYALLNQTAFRKITKKYDKAVMARPTFRYMSEKVNKTWFVQSERLQRLIVETEDLYSRYFERNNHKAAVSKLRISTHKHYYSASVFRNGIMLSAGVILGIQGIVYAAALDNDKSNLTVSTWTNYLLQVCYYLLRGLMPAYDGQLYGGYLLALILFLLFVLDCRQWSRAKINYVFVFEFDSRHNLDWRQLAEVNRLAFCACASFLPA